MWTLSKTETWGWRRFLELRCTPGSELRPRTLPLQSRQGRTQQLRMILHAHRKTVEWSSYEAQSFAQTSTTQQTQKRVFSLASQENHYRTTEKWNVALEWKHAVFFRSAATMYTKAAAIASKHLTRAIASRLGAAWGLQLGRVHAVLMLRPINVKSWGGVLYTDQNRVLTHTQTRLCRIACPLYHDNSSLGSYPLSPSPSLSFSLFMCTVPGWHRCRRTWAIHQDQSCGLRWYSFVWGPFSRRSQALPSWKKRATPSWAKRSPLD